LDEKSLKIENMAISQSKIFILDINGLKKDLLPGTYSVGRGTDVDIQINDPGISRKHLTIKVIIHKLWHFLMNRAHILFKDTMY
jgi:pSer/pThr/pTyr-binding forkhead associated (FHA) protein